MSQLPRQYGVTRSTLHQLSAESVSPLRLGDDQLVHLVLCASLPPVAPSATLLVALALVIGILLAAILLRGVPLLLLLAVLGRVWRVLLSALMLRGV